MNQADNLICNYKKNNIRQVHTALGTNYKVYNVVCFFDANFVHDV